MACVAVVFLENHRLPEVVHLGLSAVAAAVRRDGVPAIVEEVASPQAALVCIRVVGNLSGDGDWRAEVKEKMGTLGAARHPSPTTIHLPTSHRCRSCKSARCCLSPTT